MSEQAINAYFQTGWILYHICDKSGCGWDTDRWIYAPNLTDYSESELKDVILESEESWALHAESYNLEIFRDRYPPEKIVIGEIQRLANRITKTEKAMSGLMHQLNIISRVP